MAGIPTESAGFAGISGFLLQPPYFSGGLRRGFTFGLSARRSFGREEYIPCRKERQSLTPPSPPRRPGLALTMGSNGEEGSLDLLDSKPPAIRFGVSL